MIYFCEKCRKEHEEMPVIAYNTPFYYNILSEKDKNCLAEISNDLCIIKYPDQTDQFIRAILRLKIINHCDTMEYGIWVSLSKNSFLNYSEHFHSTNQNTVYFGYLSNNIEGYKNTLEIKMNILTGDDSTQRPIIIPHKDQEHPLVKDYYNGITRLEAERRIQNVLKIK